jgi:hypothetical protein
MDNDIISFAEETKNTKRFKDEATGAAQHVGARARDGSSVRGRGGSARGQGGRGRGREGSARGQEGSASASASAMPVPVPVPVPGVLLMFEYINFTSRSGQCQIRLLFVFVVSEKIIYIKSYDYLLFGNITLV